MKYELSVIQKTYDLIQWYIPILNRLPKTHRFGLGDRITQNLYDLLEGLIDAKYQKNKLPVLQPLNVKLEILRIETRMLSDFSLIDSDRYEYAAKLIEEIGRELGGWIQYKKNQEGTT